MRKIDIIAIMILALCGEAIFAQSSSKKSVDFSERYGILTDKNIFVRNRPPTRKAGARIVSPGRPEAMHILTGIALQEGRHVAFIEDTAARKTQRLLQGDSVAGGKLVEVTFDAVEFENNGKRLRVPIGRNLLGDVAVVTTAPTSNSTTAPSSNDSSKANTAPPPPPLPDAPNLSPEERMKLRRQQQMGDR